MEKMTVYADNAATTKPSAAAAETMMRYLTEDYGNPAAVCSMGRKAGRAVLAAREQTAKALGSRVDEVYFTSGGTESDNWAVKGAAELGAAQGKRHIITTAIEHHAVLRTCGYLEKHGFEVTYLMPDEYGRIAASQVEGALRDDTCLVSVMAANNEVGTLEPIKEIAEVCRERKVLFHTDAVQAAGHIPIDFRELGADMLSVSGHKFHAPKGAGALLIRSGLILPNLMHGGSQQRGRRAGTENVPAIAALGEALTEAVSDMSEVNERLFRLTEELAERLLRTEGAYRNGHSRERLPGTLNISFDGVEGESLLLLLDMAGICASSGSACTSGSTDPSHVLLAMGVPSVRAKGSLRLSFSRYSTPEEFEYIAQAVPQVVERLKGMR